MQLSQHPHVVARMPVNRDYGFHLDVGAKYQIQAAVCRIAQ